MSETKAIPARAESTGARRVYLFADFGKGKGPVACAWRTLNALFPTAAEAGADIHAVNSYVGRTARRWWLVECESAEDGRRCIAGYAALEHSHPEERSGHEDGCLAYGRILDQGGQR